MMSEIISNLLFELKIRYRSVSSYIYFGMFFSLSLLMALAAGGAFAGVVVSFGTGGRVMINSPLSVASFIGFLTSFNLFIIAPVFGQAICKDHINGIDQIIFSTPLKIRNFLLGRFMGAFVFMLFVLASIPLGVWVASVLPFALPSMVGANSVTTYLRPLVTVAAPNIFIFGAIFFLIGARTKKMAPIYITATLLVLMWSVSGRLLSDLDNKMLSALLDPIGLRAISLNVRYWTIEQQNTQHLMFESYYLWNRVLWMAVGFVSLVASIWLFSRKPRASRKVRPQEPTVVPTIKTSWAPLGPVDFAQTSWLTAFFKQLKFEFHQTVKSIYFLVIALAGVGYMLITGTQVGKMFGTKTFPVTYMVLDFVGGTFSLFILIIITLYAGEAVWRDRDLKINQIVDALPVPNFVLFFAKYVNLIVLTALLLTTVWISGVCIQAAYGYTQFELGQYFVRLYLIELPGYVNLITLTFFLQVVFRNKYVGHGLVVLYYLFYTFASSMGFEHLLYRFNATPPVVFSDMNRYGHMMSIYYMYNLYWMSFGALMLVLAYHLWPRGISLPRRNEIVPKISGQWNRISTITSFGAGALILGLGSFLFYQTTIVNEYETAKDQERKSYEYEVKYKSFEAMHQPQFTSVFAKVDIFPSALKMKARLDVKFVNRSPQPIDKFLMNFPDAQWRIDFSVPVEGVRDDVHQVMLYTVKTPLAPGQEFTAVYEVAVDRSTIKNGDSISTIRHNGTFFNNFEYFPSFGYSGRKELDTAKTRQKYGLSPKNRSPKIDDPHERNFTYLARSDSWLDFETIVSTDVDQIAIAPGYLQKEWVEGDRRYFQYKMDHKIQNFYAFLSGRYKVHRDRWNDVNIEIYYHPDHESNVKRMVTATQKSLEYFTKHFGPYQHKQYRIIEFPRYQTFAQAFPNTIPFSEAIGFIARVDDANDKDIDYPFYITAHELAHQWWAHQLIGANVQGSEMLSESFSQYSALMVMEKSYGREKMKKFLKYELDKYLFGRSQEDEYENPLILTESQGYIHYQKGSLIFYALKDYLGEDTLNAAIRETLQTFATQKAPYPTSLNFVDVLKRKVPAAQMPLVEDMLEKIVLFENRPTEVLARKVDDKQYQVQIEIESKKMYSDKDGKETPAEFEQEIDIGVLDKDDKYLYLKKHKIKSGKNTVQVTISGEPAKAGVDPLNVLIDRNSGDNIMNVKLENVTDDGSKETQKM